MPLLKIETNVEVTDPNEMLAELSSATATLLGKPENYVMVTMRHNPEMLFAGTTAPLAYIELKSLGLPEERTAEFSATLCDLVTRHLDVPAARTYIEFSNPARHMWGWNSTTF